MTHRSLSFLHHASESETVPWALLLVVVGAVMTFPPPPCVAHRVRDRLLWGAGGGWCGWDGVVRRVLEGSAPSLVMIMGKHGRAFIMAHHQVGG
jgi:hypothetical protein